jgi:hypothetical protein
MVMDHARSDVYGDETRLWSLVRFAEEEKHHELMRRAVAQFQAGFGVECELIPGREEVAKIVLGTSPLGALLLTSMIEWFTQIHYVEHVHDRGELDELSRDLLRFHWIDESRHARPDSVLIDEIAGEPNAEQREAAIDQLIEFGRAVDGLLANQIVAEPMVIRLTPRWRRRGRRRWSVRCRSGTVRTRRCWSPRRWPDRC